MTNPVDLPQYAPAPTVPVIGSASFATDVQNFFAWQAGGATGANVVGLAQSVVTNAKSAQESAIAAEAAVAGIDVPMWASGGNYQVGRGVKSPAAIAAGTPPIYICKVAISGGTTDPYNDPVHWSIFTVSNGVGGAVYTTSTTLTASSPFAISISGGSGVWLKLPDATQLSTGLRHAVRNTGDNDLTLIDASGAHIGFIRPQSGTTIALSDNSTAAGKWAGDWESVGITADLQFGAAIAGLQNVKQIIQLDATRTMVLTGGSSGQGLYAVVYDTATQSAGAAVLVRAAINGAMAIKSATDQVLVASFDSGNIYASVLTISVKEITGVTSSNTTIAGAFSSTGHFVAVGGAFACSYFTTSGIVRAITISGTTPSIGAEQSAAASASPRLYVNGSMLRVVRVSNSSTVICTPYSISGNTLTAGTAASTATAANEGAIRSFQYQSGDIVVLHANGGYWVASIFKISSTTEAVSSSNINTHGTLTASSINIGYYDYAVVDATKIAFICTVNSGYDSSRIANIVNTNGTPVVSQVTDVSVASQYFTEIKTSISGEVGFTANTGNTLLYFDCSGAYPVKTRQFLISGKYSGTPIYGNFLSKNTIGIYSAYTLLNSRSISCITSNNGNSYFTPIYSIDSSGLKIPVKVLPIIRATPTIRGENNQSAFCVTTIDGTNGVSLQRVEVAQI